MMILFKRNVHKSNNNCQEPIKVIYLFYIFQAAITPAIMSTPHTWKTLDETSLLNTIKWTYINDQNMKLSFDIFWNTKGTCMNNICDFYLSKVCKQSQFLSTQTATYHLLRKRINNNTSNSLPPGTAIYEIEKRRKHSIHKRINTWVEPRVSNEIQKTC